MGPHDLGLKLGCGFRLRDAITGADPKGGAPGARQLIFERQKILQKYFHATVICNFTHKPFSKIVPRMHQKSPFEMQNPIFSGEGALPPRPHPHLPRRLDSSASSLNKISGSAPVLSR